MNKRGVEEVGPAISVEALIFTILAIAALIALFFIFTKLIP